MKFNNKNKLIKVDNGYVLLVDNIMYATDNDKLSLKNCQEIERGYDLDELAYEYDLDTIENVYGQVKAFKAGFQKALELMGDKKFSEEDVRRAIEIARNGSMQEQHNGYGRPTELRFVLDDVPSDYIIQSLQQTEWDVEIVMGPCYYDDSLGGFSTSYKEGMPTEQPKLDSNGHLILKRVNL